MATKPKTTTGSTALAKWDEELAKHAQAAAKMEENTASGRFFSTSGGILAWNDAPMPDNRMAVIILDAEFENTYYEGEFDPKRPQPPLCYAFGRDEKSMAPFKVVVEAGNNQADACHGCPMNEFGTAERGKGKACKNSRRLAVIPAGTIDKNGHFEPFDDLGAYESSALAFLRPPVTSVKGYAAYVKQVASALSRPPFGVFTKVSLVPDAKNQFAMTFEPLAKVPDEMAEIIMRRVQEARDSIEFAYPLPGDEEEAPARRAPPKRPATNRPAAKRPAAKKAGRKY